MSGLRFGIIGCGGISRAHLGGCKAAGAQVVATADTNFESAEKLAAEAGGAKAFKSAEELLNSGMADAVCICSTPCAHEGPAVLALSKGIHVLLEKPMADTLESARKIDKAASKSKAKLMLAYRHRFLPAVQEMKKALDSGAIGKAALFHNTFCGPAFYMKDRWFSKKAVSGGGTLMDTSSHSIDLFRYIVGEPVESAALMSRRLEGTDVEDVSAMLLKSAGGVVGSLTASWVAGDGIAYVEIVGEKGRVKYTYWPHKLELKADGAKEPVEVSVPQSDGFKEELAHFVNCVETDADPMIGAKDGLRGVEIISEAYKGARL